MNPSRLWSALFGWLAPAEPAGPAFTPRARHLFALARMEAARRKHGRIEALHVWVALLRMDRCAGVEALRRLGADPTALALQLDSLLVSGEATVEAGQLKYSSELKKTLAMAASEARTMNHRFVGTDHILLGLLWHGQSQAIAKLSVHAIDLDRTRANIRALGAGEQTDAAPDRAAG